MKRNATEALTGEQEKKLADKRERICLVGSGNWGSAIAKIIGGNVHKHAEFHPVVNMYVYEEQVEVDGKQRNLSEVINERHENVKYLPGHILPDSIVAVPDLVEAVRDASMLIFVVPHQFVDRICRQIKDKVAPNAKAISLIKGMVVKDGDIQLISDFIRSGLGIDVSVLMGANIASEVADGAFCEATIGFTSALNGLLWEKLFHTDRFRISTVEDIAGVELCGAVKNVIALACGYCDGMDQGSNTKAAIIRIGLKEMFQFIQLFYPDVQLSTLFESCGVADLITTCHAGRNRRCAEVFARTGKAWEVIEEEQLKGQKLQGTLTAKEVHEVLEKHKKLGEFPLLHATYRVAFENLPVDQFLSNI